MSRVYIPVLPQPQATRTKAGIRAQIQQSGLLQQGGTATEKIAAENIDLVLNGQLRWGDTFSRKVARELESLSRSDYSGVPYYATRTSESTRDEGYYEVERVEINPAHPNTEQAFEAVVALSDAGTKEEHWRSVTTKVETINTGLATGSGGLISIPATARKVKWFDKASGTESATANSTVTGEFGDVALYDPTQPSFDDPTLIYEVDYEDERLVDVRVWDDLGLSKTTTIGGTEFTQWVHAFHTQFEFEGDAVVDNGFMRMRFDEANQVVEFYQWNDGTQSWDQVTVDHTNVSFIDADFIQMGPADTRVYAEFEGGDTYYAILSFQRGNDNPVARQPEGESWTSGFETYLGQFAADQTNDPKPDQTLIPRSKLR